MENWLIWVINIIGEIKVNGVVVFMYFQCYICVVKDVVCIVILNFYIIVYGYLFVVRVVIEKLYGFVYIGSFVEWFMLFFWIMLIVIFCIMFLDYGVIYKYNRV